MAEFQEVIKYKARMCNSYVKNGDCRRCPVDIVNNGRVLYCGEFEKSYPKEYEKRVIQWAKKHPAKTYADKFKEVFGFDVENLPKMYRCKEDDCTDFDFKCEACKHNGFWEKEYIEPKEK